MDKKRWGFLVFCFQISLGGQNQTLGVICDQTGKISVDCPIIFEDRFNLIHPYDVT